MIATLIEEEKNERKKKQNKIKLCCETETVFTALALAKRK